MARLFVIVLVAAGLGGFAGLGLVEMLAARRSEATTSPLPITVDLPWIEIGDARIALAGAVLVAAVAAALLASFVPRGRARKR